MKLDGLRGKYELTTKIGNGGEGTVFFVKGNPLIVGKIYKPERLKDSKKAALLEEKIKTMLVHPVDTRVNGQLSICWPLDILYDNATGRFCGYIMPRVPDGTKHLYSALRERERVRYFPHYTYKTSVIIAYNLACVVYYVHKAGHVIGDFNTSNIFVTNKGIVTLIDCDSYTIKNPNTNRIYGTEVGFAEVLAPEYQECNLSKKRLEQYGDQFSLAIHIFTLLMNNVHPFSGFSDGSKGNQIAANIIQGKCSFVKRGRRKRQLSYAPDISILPKDIYELFERSFSYTKSTAKSRKIRENRPTAAEWIIHLKKMIDTMKVCSKTSTHTYPGHLDQCPWCGTTNATKKTKDKTVTLKNGQVKIVLPSSTTIVPR